MHSALKKTVLAIIVFATLLAGLPLTGLLIRKGIHTLDRKTKPAVESESELTSVLDDDEARHVTLKDTVSKGTAILPVQELLEPKIPYTSRENAVLAINSPLIINEPPPYGKEGARFFSNEEERKKFTNLVVLFSAYNFGEATHVQEIEFLKLLFYDTVALQYQASIRLADADGTRAELILTVGHNMDESIFYITTQSPEYFDYEQSRGETETEWEDAYA